VLQLHLVLLQLLVVAVNLLLAKREYQLCMHLRIGTKGHDWGSRSCYEKCGCDRTNCRLQQDTSSNAASAAHAHAL
jgi:hypothetical protein